MQPERSGKAGPKPPTEPETRLSLGLDSAKVRGYRSGDNPARWTGHLDQVLPGRSQIAKTEHHAALPYDQLPEFMQGSKA